MKKSERLRILFVTPECAPWIKTGGLGDVSAALPEALFDIGHDMRVMLPAFPIVRQRVRGARVIARLPAEGRFPDANVLVARLPSGLTAWLLDCPALFARDGGPYQDAEHRDYVDNHLRFGLLSRAAALMSSAASPLKWRPHVLHCNDWQTGLAPAYLKLGLPEPAVSVMTIHNIAFQGIFPMDLAEELLLPPEARQMEGAEYWGKLSFLKAGLHYADAITTVSPTYAKEIQEEPLGFGMQGLLRARAAQLHGILNGVDTAQWDPSVDPFIPQPYDRDTLDEKIGNRAALRTAMGLREGDEMVLGMACRLTEQKGVDLVIEAADRLMTLPVQLAILGSGEAVYEEALRTLAALYPGRIAVRIGFDEPLAHLIEAGSDAFLMPSRYEPCGLNQMYSQRYGTPPIVRATGGLADSVVDCTPDTLDSGSATGFVLRGETAEALYAAVDEALKHFVSPRVWSAIQRNGMQRDFSWTQSAERYAEIYRMALARTHPGRVVSAEPAVI